MYYLVEAWNKLDLVYFYNSCGCLSPRRRFPSDVSPLLQNRRVAPLARVLYAIMAGSTSWSQEFGLELMVMSRGSSLISCRRASPETVLKVSQK